MAIELFPSNLRRGILVSSSAFGQRGGGREVVVIPITPPVLISFPFPLSSSVASTRVATVVKATPKKLAVAIRLATTKGAEEVRSSLDLPAVRSVSDGSINGGRNGIVFRFPKAPAIWFPNHTINHHTRNRNYRVEEYEVWSMKYGV